MAEQKDLLTYCREFEAKDVDTFVKGWLQKDQILRAILIYESLKELDQDFQVNSLLKTIEIMCLLYQRVIDYEKAILWKDWIQTLREAEMKFEYFHMYCLANRR